MIRKISLLFLTVLIAACTAHNTNRESLIQIIDQSFNLAREQYLTLNQELPDSLYPRSIDNSGIIVTNESGWWTSGFFPGSLWYLYEYFKDPELMQAAIRKTSLLEKEEYNIWDHDIGFKMFSSYGNELRLINDSTAIPILITSARTLIKRYNSTVGCIRSWGSIDDQKEYLVIIDNMMNLEILFWATKYTGDSSFYKVAISHADNTIANHFRSDGSSFHVLVYNPSNGEVIQKRTAQGYADESSWSRGQAWGLYGYTMSYRETNLKRYLDQAKNIANFIINNPNLPEDKIPYWDFNDPKIPESYRDASAGAIIASALIELSDYVNHKDQEKYLSIAEKIISSLSSDKYRSSLNTNGNFLIMHGVGNLPKKSEVDVPLSYADYYYLESMIRYYKRKTRE
jgi:unsaturated chondroitin disaccharide hydrolase